MSVKIVNAFQRIFEVDDKGHAKNITPTYDNDGSTYSYYFFNGMFIREIDTNKNIIRIQTSTDMIVWNTIDNSCFNGAPDAQYHTRVIYGRYWAFVAKDPETNGTETFLSLDGDNWASLPASSNSSSVMFYEEDTNKNSVHVHAANKSIYASFDLFDRYVRGEITLARLLHLSNESTERESLWEFNLKGKDYRLPTKNCLAIMRLFRRISMPVTPDANNFELDMDRYMLLYPHRESNLQVIVGADNKIHVARNKLFHELQYKATRTAYLPFVLISVANTLFIESNKTDDIHVIGHWDEEQNTFVLTPEFNNAPANP